MARPGGPQGARRGAASEGVVPAAAVAVALAAVGVLALRYRRDLNSARARLDTLDRRVISTEFGTLEYAEHGAGDPVLVSHGIFHGCDGGLFSTRDVVVDRRVVSPSRFGYLGSTLPAGATGADQADAFVVLLDHLQIDKIDVIGISAGTGAAVQLALRHPDRVEHLVIISGNWPGSPTATAPPGWAKIFLLGPGDVDPQGARPEVDPAAHGRPAGVSPETPKTPAGSTNGLTASSRSARGQRVPSSTRSSATQRSMAIPWRT